MESEQPQLHSGISGSRWGEEKEQGRAGQGSGQLPLPQRRSRRPFFCSVPSSTPSARILGRSGRKKLSIAYPFLSLAALDACTPPNFHHFYRTLHQNACFSCLSAASVCLLRCYSSGFRCMQR